MEWASGESNVALGAAVEAKREAVGVEIEREDEGHAEDRRAAVL